MSRKITKQLKAPYPYLNIIEKDYLIKKNKDDQDIIYFEKNGSETFCLLSNITTTDNLPTPLYEINLSELAHFARTEYELNKDIKIYKQQILDSSEEYQSDYYLIQDATDNMSPFISGNFKIYSRTSDESQKYIKIINISLAETAETDHSYFSEIDLSEGDIIDFSIKLINHSEAYAKIIWEQKIRNDTTLNEEVKEISKVIHITNSFFYWSFESYCDNLGYRLDLNKKIGKPFKLQIYAEQNNDTNELSNYINDAIVTYTLLTFDD